MFRSAFLRPCGSKRSEIERPLGLSKNVINRAEFRFEFGADFLDALMHHPYARILHLELAVASVDQVLQILLAFYPTHRPYLTRSIIKSRPFSVHTR